MSEKLLPCPFCGEEVELKQGKAFEWPECNGCKGTGLYTVWKAEERDKAIEAWNRRAATQHPSN